MSGGVCFDAAVDTGYSIRFSDFPPPQAAAEVYLDENRVDGG